MERHKEPPRNNENRHLSLTDVLLLFSGFRRLPLFFPPSCSLDNDKLPFQAMFRPLYSFKPYQRAVKKSKDDDKNKEDNDKGDKEDEEGEEGGEGEASASADGSTPSTAAIAAAAAAE
jgi:hypothetical protein